MQQDLRNHSHTSRCLGGCKCANLFRSPRGRGQRLHDRRVPPVRLSIPSVEAITAPATWANVAGRTA